MCLCTNYIQLTQKDTPPTLSLKKQAVPPPISPPHKRGKTPLRLLLTAFIFYYHHDETDQIHFFKVFSLANSAQGGSFIKCTSICPSNAKGSRLLNDFYNACISYIDTVAFIIVCFTF